MTYDPDPPHTWMRKLYDETIIRSLDYKKDEDRRKGSEIETNRDLDKPMEQLVCDVHEETHDPKRQPLENIAGAQKRMTSMLARVARSNQRVADRMLGLTWAIGIMTTIILIFGGIAAWPVIRDWLPNASENKSESTPTPSASPIQSVTPETTGSH